MDGSRGCRVQRLTAKDAKSAKEMQGRIEPREHGLTQMMQRWNQNRLSDLLILFVFICVDRGSSSIPAFPWLLASLAVHLKCFASVSAGA